MRAVKRKYLVLFVCSLLLCVKSTFPATPSPQVSVSFQIFYDELSPYGQWVDDPAYGYIWLPDMGPDFIPYSTDGYWVWTNYGWAWVSNYSWGWAPFHYGRWDYSEMYGWAWVPDNEWGPAWVVWRRSPDYYGWAPLAPGISFDMAIAGNYNIPASNWSFIHHQDMGRTNLNSYYGPRKNNQTLLTNSTVVQNTYVDNSRSKTYIAGPKGEDVQKATGRRISQVQVKEDSRPGQTLKNNELHIYRPAITTTTAEKPKPAKVVDKKEIRPVSERKKQESTTPVKNSEIKKDVIPSKERTVPVTPKKVEKVVPPKTEQKPVQKPTPPEHKTNTPPTQRQQEKQPAQKPQNQNPPPQRQQNPAPPKPQQKPERPIPLPQNIPRPQPAPRPQPMPRPQPSPQPQHKPH